MTQRASPRLLFTMLDVTPSSLKPLVGIKNLTVATMSQAVTAMGTFKVNFMTKLCQPAY